MYKKLSSGFSIEFEYNNSDLELCGEHEGLPLYKVIGGKVTAIALVNKPANKSYCVADDSNHTITGLVMIPDVKMFRNEPENCYWYFPAETIKKLGTEYFNTKLKLGH